MWLSTAVDYSVARQLDATDHEPSRRRLLGVSIAVNLGVLGFFKYANFFVDSAQDLASRAGFDTPSWTLNVLLPVGISFYTFQTLAYTIDVYRRRLPAEDHLPTFALYVAYFPQLVAGPIERATRLLPQLRDLPGRVSSQSTTSGLRLILFGLIQKAVLADVVAPHVNAVYANPEQTTLVSGLAAIVGFSIQIYGDFAGYSNIARGTSRLLGVELMVNFTQPYLSRSITEFWRRWHISLSLWLRDYLYIPLGGNRGTINATRRNLMLTMLLGGLWHGAAWTFVVWGGLHGLYLLLERGSPVDERTAPGWAATTFALVALTWVPFRAASFSDAIDVLLGLSRLNGTGQLSVIDIATVFLAGLAMVTLDQRRRNQELTPDTNRPVQSGALYGAAAVMVFIATATTAEPFIYFQF